MADETIQDDHPDIAPKSAPKAEREPIVIEGEATDLTPPESEPALPETRAEQPESTEPEVHAAPEAEPVAEFAPETQPEPEPSAPEPPAPAPAVTPPKSGSAVGRVASLTLGLVVVVAVSAFTAVYVAPLLNDDKKAAEEHIDAIDAALKDEMTARKALEARLVKLEGSVVTAQADAKAAANKAPGPTGSAPPVATIAAAPTDDALAGRVAKLEAAFAEPAPNPEVAKLATSEGALRDRIAKLETALAAQQGVAETIPPAVAKSLDPVAEAVAAISLAQRLAEGEPYAAEFAALAKSGADGGALAALKPYADSGAPTSWKLAVAFAKLAPSFTSPANTGTKGVIVDQVMDKLRALVKVHTVGEIPGDDPAALASQISAALARGDVAAALAIEAKLPEAARSAAAGWAKDAAGMENATAAARSLAETALKRFADAKN